MWHWLAHWLGLNSANGPTYLWWSGFAGDIPLFGGAAVLYRRHNCHAKGCLRIGLHRVDGTHLVTCRRHHPDHHGRRPYTAEQINNLRKETETS